MTQFVVRFRCVQATTVVLGQQMIFPKIHQRYSSSILCCLAVSLRSSGRGFLEVYHLQF